MAHTLSTQSNQQRQEPYACHPGRLVLARRRWLPARRLRQRTPSTPPAGVGCCHSGHSLRILLPDIGQVSRIRHVPGLADTHRGSNLASRRDRVSHPVSTRGLARSFRHPRRVGRHSHWDHCAGRRLVLETPLPIQDIHRLECAGEPRLGDGGEPWGSRLSNPRGRLGRGRDHPTHGPVPFELDPDAFRALTSDLAPDLFEPCPKRTRLTEPSTSVIRRGCWWLSASAFCRESGS